MAILLEDELNKKRKARLIPFWFFPISINIRTDRGETACISITKAGLLRLLRFQVNVSWELSTISDSGIFGTSYFVIDLLNELNAFSRGEKTKEELEKKFQRGEATGQIKIEAYTEKGRNVENYLRKILEGNK